MKRTLLTLALLSLFIMSCEYYSDEDFLQSPPESYVDLMVEGWSAFDAGNYQVAADAFAMAAEREATLPEVYLGLGWANFRNQSLQDAKSYLNSALAFAFLDTDNAERITIEANAGLAGVALAEGDYSTAINMVDAVLAADADFAFTHDADVDVAALKRIKALASYSTGDFATAFAQTVDLDMTLTTVTHVTPGGSANASAQDTGTTAFDGIARVVVPADHHLVMVAEVTTTAANYTVTDVDEGTNVVYVYGNPALQSGDAVMVDYYYAADFGTFLSELLAALD